MDAETALHRVGKHVREGGDDRAEHDRPRPCGPYRPWKGIRREHAVPHPAERLAQRERRDQ